MKLKVIAAVGAVLVLGACGSGGEDKAGGEAAPDAAAPEASAPESAPEAADASAAAPAAGDTPSKEFVVGKWGTDGDCAMAMDLKADGTSDGPFGNWTYTDGTISFADAPELKIKVKVVDDKTMESDNGSGKKSKMTRC